MPNEIVSAAELNAVQQRIAKQQALIDGLRPGSEHHKLAVELLLTYRDSLFVLEELADLARVPGRTKPGDRW